MRNRKTLFALPLLLAAVFVFARFVIIRSVEPSRLPEPVAVKPLPADSVIYRLYDSLDLSAEGLPREVFNKAVSGLRQLDSRGKLRNNHILSIADFSQPSNQKRLYIIDLAAAKVLFHTFVSHGRGSGVANATAFSNQAESYKSSLGFYTTQDVYDGKHGLSLRLNGEEKGINDNALSRGIVMHCAAYVSEQIAKAQGYIGRSLGCPAVPEGLHKQIISAIRGGSCLFIYSNDKTYASQSSFLRTDSAANLLAGNLVQ